MTDLWSWIRKLWAPIAGLLGAITAIVQFINLWHGDQAMMTQIIWIGSALLVWLSLFHIGFSLSVTWMPISDRFGLESRHRVQAHRFGEIPSLVARILFFVSFVGMLALWGTAIHRQNILNSKTVVLVADFDGPDPKEYRVTEKLLSQLSSSLEGYEDTLIIPLGQPITEQEGSKKAIELGKYYHATIVIWGWYGVTQSDALVTVHIENLSRVRFLPLPVSNLYATQVPAFEIQSFQVQQRLSSEITSLVFFLSGVVRYEANDYQAAVSRLTKALGGEWPDDLLSKKFAYYYRGMCYLSAAFNSAFGSNLEHSTEDLSSAITLDPSFLPAYYSRSFAYALLNDNEHSKEDFQIVLNSSPEAFFTHKELGNLAMFAGDTQRAIDFLTLALNDDPSDFLSLYDRGSNYYFQGDYQKGLSDISQAILLEPNLWLLYEGRAEIYRSLGKDELAFQDLKSAERLFPSNQDATSTAFIYYERGRIYAREQDFNRSLDNYSHAIELDPSFMPAYLERGELYSDLKQYDQAIQDFSYYIEVNGRDFTTPYAYYDRAATLEKQGDPEHARFDYAIAAQFYAHIAKTWQTQGRMDEAKAECERVLGNYQTLLSPSHNPSIMRFAQVVTKGFGGDCPDTLQDPFPPWTWQYELTTNPITPGAGMAGIQVGDPVETVTKRLDAAVTWSTLVGSNVEDCCIVGGWASRGSVLAIFFDKTNEKVVGVYLDARGDPPHSEFVPTINGISIGSSEKDLLSRWGPPITSQDSLGTKDCTDYNYDGIGFQVCGTQRLVIAIGIPSLDAWQNP